MLKRKHIYIFFLFFFILWNPIHAYLIPYDGNGRLISFFGILFIFFGISNLSNNYIKESIYFDLPYVLWVIWVTINSIFFNPILNPELDASIFFIRVFLPFIIYFGIRLNFLKVEIERQWLWLSIALLFYLILVLLFEKENTELKGRLGNFIGSNEIAWIGLLALFSSSVIVGKSVLKYLTILIVTILILFTASKKALLSFILFFMLKFLIFGKVSPTKRISIIIIFFTVFIFAVPIFLKDTYIGERIQESIVHNEQAEDNSELFDGRAKFYIVGMKLLEKGPITGIGLNNFYNLGGMDLAAHSEYVVQLVELGIIGFILFLIFHLRILITLIKLNKKKEYKQMITILLISVLIIYGMFLGRWVYDDIAYHIFLALIVNTIINYKKKLKFQEEH